MVEDKDECKIICTDCGWIGFSEDLLEAVHPFDDTDKVYGCPQCREIGSTTTLIAYQMDGGGVGCAH